MAKATKDLIATLPFKIITTSVPASPSICNWVLHFLANCISLQKTSSSKLSKLQNMFGFPSETPKPWSEQSLEPKPRFGHFQTEQNMPNHSSKLILLNCEPLNLSLSHIYPYSLYKIPNYLNLNNLNTYTSYK